jgi:hypothetical protein
MWQVGRASIYDRVLTFLETVYAQRGAYERGNATAESPLDVLILNYTKVVNDCCAIRVLVQRGFYIQAAIISRSTIDSCNLMMHIAFEGEKASLVQQWLNDQNLKHWNLMKTLNRGLDQGLDLDLYEARRKELDDFVHANFSALQLYPAQSPGPTPLDEGALHRITSWMAIIDLFLVSCLLTVPLIVPDLEVKANRYLQQIMRNPSRPKSVVDLETDV